MKEFFRENWIAVSLGLLVFVGIPFIVEIVGGAIFGYEPFNLAEIIVFESKVVIVNLIMLGIFVSASKK